MGYFQLRQNGGNNQNINYINQTLMQDIIE